VAAAARAVHRPLPSGRGRGRRRLSAVGLDARAGDAIARAPLLALKEGLTFRLDLRAPVAPPPPTPFVVREVPRAEVEGVLATVPELARKLVDLDAVAPAGWRCFIATEGPSGRLVRMSFVELRPSYPLLFGSVTAVAERRRNATRATVAFIAAKLRDEGHEALWASVSGANLPSVRAYQAAGFTLVERFHDVRVLGVSLRGVARRLRRGR
jgi:hypothetical protein